MDFLIAPERLELAEAVRDYLSGTHGPEVLRKLDADGNRDPAIWQGLVEMGLPGLLVPEEEGGLGMGLLDAVLIARECGRFCLAEPLVESAYVSVPWMIARGDTGRLAEVAAGEFRPIAAHSINGWHSDGDGGPLHSVDPLRNLAQLPGDASDDPQLLDLGALMASAQLVGLAEAMLDQAVEYSKLREQFGQPVGGFQAIKHKLADVAVALEFARPVLWRAAQALEDGAVSASLHVSHAKLAASDAAYLAGESAIQVHGAMGYTYEVDLHFWMKRAWALSGAWGSRGFHARRVDAAIIGGDHPIGPQNTFA
ncbi:putative acyl-CoA dehydrogenase FadE [Erythrobacter sp. Dej080120_24]|uniref:acyl-CoA dehydrogenase family protein n=1 Tax=Erythrobacter sp. Dej080120_24 TaxID=3024837 RepID=UPI0004D451E0|nr:acyl-CoA dehydrogenase [Erythrobacter sp. JL475]BDW83431.1 putative acyl-CoA dehydrogenase FadE [Erythrobacter sp. Dej080120_24]